ncbi:MAG TPA: type II toxin-antitoxin system VapC family toxin [Coxiellaceae bacterium]|nr:MAG: hypothetical protein A3E81_00865 [Gammaproteobacteria bacterium RIFCSPHIGHO2_12_FULL_36_30]HLB56711.1 type II toxin-antitoxin system VapC family toxin [Coxiellaceae bacterium]
MNGKDNFLLDTNVVLGFLNGNSKISDFFEKKLMQSTLHVSQITRMKLLGYSGITSEEEKHLKKFLSYVKVLPINDAVCDQAITLRREKKLKLPDALIAATAICFDLMLVTCDSDLLDKNSHFRSMNPITA